MDKAIQEDFYSWSMCTDASAMQFVYMCVGVCVCLCVCVCVWQSPYLVEGRTASSEPPPHSLPGTSLSSP